MKTRYPGIRPFETEEENIFFGRDEDIQQLLRLIKLEKLVVLSGKSGLGKSSLLNAGVVPQLETDGYKILNLRLGSYTAGEDLQILEPQDLLKQRIKGDSSEQSFLYDITDSDTSVWFQAKNQQLIHSIGRGFVLVLDQFEELFNWPSEAIDRFKKELASLLNWEISPQVSQALKSHLREDPDFLSDEQLDQLYTPLNVKVVMAIRSDRLAQVNQMKNVLPEILKEVYELKPLGVHQARDVIVLPAQLDGAFNTPPFEYDPQSLMKILEFLTDGFQDRVESFQLQLICQFIEDQVVPKEYNKDETAPDQGSYIVKPEDLPPLDRIFKNYYDRQIGSLPSTQDQQKARKFIEEGLIFEEEERRLSLFEGVIRSRYKISKELLQRLVDSRLIRAEPLVGGGYVYELTHDTLIPPILEAKKRRKVLHQRKRLGFGALLGIVVIVGLSFLTIWINNQRLEAERALAALQKANQQRVTELMGRFPTLINQLRFEEAIDLVEQALDIQAAPALSQKAAAELLFYFSEAGKPAWVWTLWAKLDSTISDGTNLSTLDSLNFLQHTMTQLISESELDSLHRKYYPVMANIEGGTYLRGTDAKDTVLITSNPFAVREEVNLHEVELSSFEIGIFEITVLQYQLFCESSNNLMPNKPLSWGYVGNNPMVHVSWLGAISYCNWLSKKNGLAPIYEIHDAENTLKEDSIVIRIQRDGFRLPTEAEWEYAAGGGKQGRMTTGARKYLFAGNDSLPTVGWYIANSDKRTQPVGMKAPNELGLYDFSGNVSEWCSDWFGKYPENKVMNPVGIEKGSTKIFRGGSWISEPKECRVSYRGGRKSDFDSFALGFRIARSIRP